jgi:TIR domain-containing protein/FHA domain-containing protein
MSHIFVSYSRKDVEFVEMLREKLREANFEVWTDSGVRPGNDWRTEIDDAIRGAFVVLVVVTPAARVSEYVAYEWAFALGAGIKVIPMIVEAIPLHPRLEFLQHFEFSGSRDEGYPWDKLIEGLQQIKQDTRSPTLPGPKIGLPDFGTARLNAPGVWLITQHGPQPEQRWNLNKDMVTVGREITNDIVINDQQVSRRHVRFVRITRGIVPNFAIEDLGSSNGTFVNSERLQGSKPLKDGDVIQLGDTVILAYKLIIE